MNAFFSFSEVLKSDCPLKHLTSSLDTKDISISKLDKPLAKDLASTKENKETTEAKDARELTNEEKEALKEKTDKQITKSDTSDAQDETAEKNDLTEEEVNEKQREAIKDALERLARGEELTEKEKGNLCEMMMDQYYISQGYTPLHSPRVTSLDDKGHQGIDGVYQKGDHYVVSDAKYDQAQQKETQDGRQMSDTWIDRRLDESVGKEKADEIRNAEEDGRVSHEIYHYDPNSDEAGNTYSDVHTVDENGNSNRDKHDVECYNASERKNLNNGGENDA